MDFTLQGQGLLKSKVRLHLGKLQRSANADQEVKARLWEGLAKAGV